MEVSPGMMIFAMVLDTLSGRTPFYRLTEFFEEKDTVLLLLADIEPERFCDSNLGRAIRNPTPRVASSFFFFIAGLPFGGPVFL
ncbi:DUF4277 domain-containing protein [Desulfosarcina ovata]|uniref:DUF4277 domain-containing protein n=1 Tax=Desulfosarcina ovata subsp. ovata TaxID=2752305 RepID=A0A5K8ANU8_9BACT|nr:DUF4277 domain-containing protein [Desulfosarcina ovata]BBO93304.1 hypothetical protein DSCOOX_64840 [Desulfosarcina ovata subsp. ovata]